MLANVLKLKTEISHLHKYFRPFTQYFVEAPLAVITTSSLLGYDATSLPKLYLGNFSHSSLQILSSSVRLKGERRCTVIFRSLQRCSDWFKSGLWLGHSRTFRDLSLPVGKWTFTPVWGPELFGAGFHQGSLCTLLLSSFPRSWRVSPLKNIPTAWCLHHHASS